MLVLLPAVANDFFPRQIVGWTMILGMIALSLMFLAGYGGMVSLAQMTVAGVAGYMIAVLGASSLPKDQPVLAVVGSCAAGNRHRGRFRHAGGRALRPHRGHLHDHDHAGDRSVVLLPDPAELADL